MMIHVTLPNGSTVQYTPRSSVHAGQVARNLARKYGFWTKGTIWQLRGPLGVIDARQEMRRLDLNEGETLKLEQREVAQ